MKRDENNTVSKYQAMTDKCRSLAAKISAAMSFFTPELSNMPPLGPGGGGVGLHLGAERVETGGLTDVEGADPGAPQRRQVGPAAQGGAQVPGDGAHVGPRGAVHVQIKVDDVRAVPGPGGARTH